MKNRFKLITLIAVLMCGIALGIFLRHQETTWTFITKPFSGDYIKFDDTRKNEWDRDFELVEIKSVKDNSLQKAYFYKSRSGRPGPLVVSLHTWSGDYKQKDELAEICKQKDINYIHPDFRGANKTADACCSELAMADIDDAITFAVQNSDTDTSRIFIIGVSGGGYATLCSFMKSKHNIRKFSAWASITDLIAWYNESKIRINRYDRDILDCTGSGDVPHPGNMKGRSPLYWKTPVEKLNSSKLYIYTGIYDGIQGSVPITHSINFYNKILSDLQANDSSAYISIRDELYLLEKREPLGEFGNLAGRKIYLKKEFKNLKLIIFEGNHEMLTELALNELLEE